MQTVTPDRILELARKADISVAAVKTVLAELGVPTLRSVPVPDPVRISDHNWRIGGWRIDLGRKYDYPSTREQAEAENWHIKRPDGGLWDSRDTLEEAFEVVRAHYGDGL